jgi:GTP-binding protein
MLPVVSIVGRPNVGKSTLFNRLIGERKAIVHDIAGVTRDRHYGESFWADKEFSLIDTGGYVADDQDVMMQGIREQVHLAVDESDVILFIVDVETGITDLDKNIAELLRRQARPVLVVANKADNEQRSWQASEFYALGYDEIFSVSSVNGTGTGDLLDRVVELLPEPQVQEESNTPKLAIVGRPNVGKSSLVNALLGYQRSIVTDIAGTTRDSINSNISYNDKEYILVDTAGLRRKTRISESVEFYSTLRTHKAVREAHIVILVIDAVQGFEAQDIRILAEAERFNKGIILVLNKWDLVEKDTNTFKDYVEAVYEKIPTMKYIPVLTTSALTKQRIFKILELSDEVLEQRGKKISTSQLNKFIEDVTKERPAPVARGAQLKIKYATQVKTNPPVFAFFMNRPVDLPANYRRFLENRIRDTFGFEGVPITMVFKEK